MALEKAFENLINEGRITVDRVKSLEAQIAEVRQRSDEEFKDLDNVEFVKSELYKLAPSII